MFFLLFKNSRIIHMFWECPPVAVFWRLVASNFSTIFDKVLPCSPAALILNDLPLTGLTICKRRALLAGLTAAKKLVVTRWTPPHCLSVQAWFLVYLDVAYLEISIARIHGAKDSVIEMWSIVINDLQKCLEK